MLEKLEAVGAYVHTAPLGVDDLAQCAGLFDGLENGQPGKRITSTTLRQVSAVAEVMPIVEKHLGSGAKPVRGTLFDKRADRNWALGWHQDRTIAVKARREVAGFGPWTVKQGICHVAPPVALLASMLTVRIHIDPVDSDNAPLQIAPGSHRLGLVSEADIPSVVERCGSFECLADSGDIWVYSTLILHASARASVARRRRVLQIDFSAETLPGGLEWATA